MTLPIDPLIATAAPTSGLTLYTADLNAVLTQLRDRAGELPSVRDKGAIGNGSADDRTAFSLLTAGWWVVPPGTFKIGTSLTLAAGVSLWVLGGMLAPAASQTLTVGANGRLVHDGTGIGGPGIVAAGAGTILNLSSGGGGGIPDAPNDGFFYLRHALGWSSAGLDAFSPATTVGDLIVRGATTSARLAVGVNGSVPLADSSQPLGLRYGQVNAASVSESYLPTSYTAPAPNVEGHLGGIDGALASLLSRVAVLEGGSPPPAVSLQLEDAATALQLEDGVTALQLG